MVAAASVLALGSFYTSPASACNGNPHCTKEKCMKQVKTCCKNKTCKEAGGCKSNAKKKPCATKSKCKGKAQPDHSDNARYNN